MKTAGFCQCLAASLLFPGAVVQAQVDLTGMWTQQIHMDGPIGEAEYGDYTALPLNEAGRLRAETWSDQKWTVPEHQCEPHPIDYAIFGPAAMRVCSEVTNLHSRWLRCTRPCNG